MFANLSKLRDPSNKWPFRLGVWGLIPFYAGAIGCVLAKDEKTASAWKQWNTKYGAVILSFVGAVHWGTAVSTASPIKSRLYLFSVIPALGAFGSTLLAQPLSIWSQSFMFAAIPLYEYRYLPITPWYMNLRLVLSGGAFIAQTLCGIIK